MQLQQRTRGATRGAGCQAAARSREPERSQQALLKHMPDKAEAMTERVECVGVVSRATGEKAHKALLAKGKIQRIGRAECGSLIGTS